MKQLLIKCVPVIAAGVLLFGTARAQDTGSATSQTFRTWSVGVNLGGLTPINPFGGKNDFSNYNTSFGYGLYIKKQFTPYFSLRLDGVGGNLSGDNSKAFNSGATVTSPVSAYKTDLNWSASLSAVVNMFNIDMFRKEDRMQLYTSFGAGLAGYKPTITTSTGTAAYSADQINELIIPVGLGAKFRLSDAINIDLGWTVNFLDGDNLDGYYARDNNDKYSYAYGGLEFALGQGKQLAFHNPVALTYDEALAAKNTANALKSDLDAQKAENAKLRQDLAALSADSDGDGVSDKFDKCPGTPANTVVDGSGCAIKVPAPVVQEKVIITEADRQIVADAIKNLEFDFAKATIRPTSYSTLNRVAALLAEKNISLKLAGHTDNVGSNDANLKLSKARAESVKAYLVSQGANPSRIEATGYGETQPIATNGTAAGRQKNRRVEFTIY